MRNYSASAFIIGIRNFSEADKVLTVFSQNYGKLQVLAKGARKPSSRKRGALDVFNKVKINAVRGRSLDIVTDVQIIDNSTAIKDDLKKTTVAYFFCEVIDKLTVEHEKNESLYIILESYLYQLISSKKIKDLRIAFIKDVLVSLGFWPDGKEMLDADKVLENVAEKRISSVRVGKRLLS